MADDEDLQAQIEQLRAQVTRLTASVEEWADENRALSGLLADREAQIAALTKSNHKVNQRALKAEAALAKTQGKKKR